MEKKDVFRHLVGIEREAADLVREAQREADLRLDEAKKVAGEAFRKAYEGKAAELEASLRGELEALEAAHGRALTEYGEGLIALAESADSFAGTVGSLLETEA